MVLAVAQPSHEPTYGWISSSAPSAKVGASPASLSRPAPSLAVIADAASASPPCMPTATEPSVVSSSSSSSEWSSLSSWCGVRTPSVAAGSAGVGSAGVDGGVGSSLPRLEHDPRDLRVHVVA